MRMSDRFNTIHPDAARLAELAIGAALIGEQVATIRYNQQLVAFHQARARCPAVKARATRTLEHLAARLAAREPAPAPVAARPIAARSIPPEHYDWGELKREVLEALLSVDQPLSVAELARRLRTDRDRLRKALIRLDDAGVLAKLPARDYRRDLDFRTAWCWTTVDRAAELAG